MTMTNTADSQDEHGSTYLRIRPFHSSLKCPYCLNYCLNYVQTDMVTRNESDAIF